MASPAPLNLPPPNEGPNRAARRHPTPVYAGISEAAIILGVTTKFVRKLVAEGELPAYRIGAKMLRVKITDLDAVCKPI